MFIVIDCVFSVVGYIFFFLVVLIIVSYYEWIFSYVVVGVFVLVLWGLVFFVMFLKIEVDEIGELFVL